MQQKKVATKKTTHWYAQQYINRYGFHLVPIKPNSKQPIGNNWGEVLTPAEYWQEHPEHGIGSNLGPSLMCSTDIDCSDSLEMLSESMGLPFNDLESLPVIKGASKGYRVMLRVPDGVDLPYCKLTWPSKLDPTGDKHRDTLRRAREAKEAGHFTLEDELREEAKQYAPYTVFELRASQIGGKARQDILPPSIHPDTGEPYQWISKPPNTLDEWPTPPDWLLTIWREWDKFGPQLRAACPWIEQPEAPKPKKPSKANKEAHDVQTEFNNSYDLAQMLEHYGYKRRGKSYLSPHSTTNIAGVHIFKCGTKAYIHHASDPLCSTENNRPVSCYDLYVEYEHGGDRKKAFKAAAEQLGIELKPKATTVYNEPPPNSPAVPENVGPAIVKWVHESARGKPLGTLENIIQLCDIYGITARYNVIAKEEVITVPDTTFTMDNNQANSLAMVLSYAQRHQIPTGNIPEYMTIIADRNKYNPVVNWVTSKSWDGVDRFPYLLESLGKVEKPELAEALLKRWLITGIAAAFEPDGVAAQGVLVLQGAQGTGKTSWFKALFGEHQELAIEGFMLNPQDKDSVKIAVSHWGVEMGEIDATFRKADIAALKAFITSPKDEIFLRYSRKSSKYPRRTFFFASVNDTNFLKDTTGNRRFWTIATGDDLNPNHNIDIQQMWAQVYETWYKNGESWALNKHEYDMLNESNTDHEETDPIDELISLHYDFGVDRREPTTATAIAKELGFREPSRRIINDIGRILKARYGLEKKKVRGQRVYSIPPPKRGF